MSNLENNTTELEELLNIANSLPVAAQSDWAQTDETQLDYIKNKPIFNITINQDTEKIEQSIEDIISAAQEGKILFCIGALSILTEKHVENDVYSWIELTLLVPPNMVMPIKIYADGALEMENSDNMQMKSDRVISISEESTNDQYPTAKAVYEALQNVDCEGNVSSVNGKIGEVVLNANDVGALPLDTVIPTVPTNVSAFTNDADYANKTYVQEIAGGKCKVYVFDFRDPSDPNYIIGTEREEVLNQWLEDVDTSILNTGDVFLIRDTEVPDYWWDGETSRKQILETTKVELEEYLKQTELTNAIDKALAAAKESGEFDGEQGATGESGATFTPSVSSDGDISWSNDKGLTNPVTVNIRGPQGPQGKTGPQGEAGATPIKGTDYFTDADKEEFLAEVLAGTKQPFKISADVDFTTGQLSDIRPTFSELESAIANGDLIYMENDISQMMPGQKAYALMSGCLAGNYAFFETSMQMQDGIYHMTCYFLADDTGNFTLTKLATQNDLSGLTFVVSSTAPTVDVSSSIVTFVV